VYDCFYHAFLMGNEFRGFFILLTIIQFIITAITTITTITAITAITAIIVNCFACILTKELIWNFLFIALKNKIHNKVVSMLHIYQ